MDIYKDEVSFWDDFVIRYLHKNFSPSSPIDYLANAAHLADQMILERRKRNVVD
ncbi:hypothetical protein [Pseudomonas laurylsulfativorans]|uniref:hypothetical protein n=1 Tax=Pseudomonas laurylsulfativorans TaxID=1943631 RepID=UPI0013FDCADE|nr:hypothetical protein [Pseudomonas laurylsulfativorans]